MPLGAPSTKLANLVEAGGRQTSTLIRNIGGSKSPEGDLNTGIRGIPSSMEYAKDDDINKEAKIAGFHQRYFQIDEKRVRCPK